MWHDTALLVPWRSEAPFGGWGSRQRVELYYHQVFIPFWFKFWHLECRFGVLSVSLWFCRNDGVSVEKWELMEDVLCFSNNHFCNFYNDKLFVLWVSLAINQLHALDGVLAEKCPWFTDTLLYWVSQQGLAKSRFRLFWPKLKTCWG